MSARTLRVLVSLLVVGVIFIYLASVQLSETLPIKAPDEGKPGAPIAGLTRRQLDKFYRCKEVFLKVFGPQDGLGPLFNEAACVNCHGGVDSPGAGGTADVYQTTLIAKRSAKSKLAKTPLAEAREKLESADLDYLQNEGGPILVKKSIIDQFSAQLAELQLPKDCHCPAVSRPPANAELVSRRLAAPLYGLGMLGAVGDLYISGLSDVQKRTKSPVKGKCVIPPVEINGLAVLGRFGSKGQAATLTAMCAKELGVHLGLSNQLNPHSISSTGVDNLPVCIKTIGPPDPNVDGKMIAQLVYYVTLLAPPKPVAEPTVEMEQGERIFKKLGCAECHVPSLRTLDKVYVVDPDGPVMIFHQNTLSDGRISYQPANEPMFVEIRALERTPVEAYTDLLVHNMGKELADGMASGNVSGGQWRTAPLWGCKDRKSYLHDGRANTLDTAITMHGGEAAESVKEFRKLPQNVKDSVISFLQSL